ncbi:MAG: sugar ABC transporter ATP-binding protein [Spirochaetes bacterium]|nr:sugar ABC transporter ATP-binding protein [Spirochaetota bacterium]
MAQTLLKMNNITKTFPGAIALDNVSLQVEKGEIHAIVGENGAGKSTLMNVLSGVFSHNEYVGDIEYEEKHCKFNTIRDSEHVGIVIIHQELALVPLLSIGENMFLGNERGKYVNIDWDETFAKADSYLKLVGLNESSRTLVKDISVGKQQLVEIAKALAKDVKLLILDEPTASLNESDSRKLLDLLLDLRQKGVTSILISHKLNEVEYIADKITVIRDGAVIKTLDKKNDSFTEDDIITAMVGRTLTDRFPKRNSSIGEVCLEIKNWNVYHPLYEDKKVCDNVNLTLRKGEIVGISGLMGAGRTELAMSIFGKSYGQKISGELILNGKKIHLNSIKEAIKEKIAYVTEDRKDEGLLLNNPIYINTTLAKMDKVSKYNILDLDLEVKVSNEYRQKLNTKCSNVMQSVGSLSGGNQQKVLLSKWMFADPDVLMLDEPTRGIDVGAKYEIYTIMNQLVAEGKSVLMISSEMPEILGMCDRIYVMYDGRIVAEFSKEQATQESIMAVILSSAKGV